MRAVVDGAVIVKATRERLVAVGVGRRETRQVRHRLEHAVHVTRRVYVGVEKQGRTLLGVDELGGRQVLAADSQVPASAATRSKRPAPICIWQRR